jgi:hypothetical protein
MKIVLNIINAKNDASSPHKSALQISSVAKESQDIFQSLQYWGAYGAKKRIIMNTSSLVDVLKTIKPGIYVLSDAESGKGSTELRFSFRNELISIQCWRSAERDNLREESQRLIRYFKLLYITLQEVIGFPLVSSISLPEIDYARRRPPKRWRAFDPWGIVDFIRLSQVDFPDAEKITNNLCYGTLPEGVVREIMNQDMVIIDWTNLAMADKSIDKTLSNRSEWFYTNSEFERDTSFNEWGDLRVDVFDNKKTSDLTFYDRMTESGYKAIGFDPANGFYEIDKLQKLNKLLRKKKTSEGLPILNVYVIVAKREFAISLKAEIDNYNLSGILYADDDGQLWNPFPDGLWLS